MRLPRKRSSNNTASHDTWYEIKVVFLLCAGFGLVGFDRWLITPLFPHMMRDLGLNYQQLGALFGILSLTWGLWAIVGGPLSDRLGRKKILVITMVAFSILSCVTGLAASFVSLMIVRALMGAAEGPFLPASVATVAEVSLPARRTFNQGLLMAMFSIFGMGLGPVVATQLLQVLPSWHWVFVISALPGLIVATLVAATLRSPARSKLPQPLPDGPPRRWTEVLRSRNVWIAAFAMPCAMAGVFVVTTMLPSYLVNDLHIDTQHMGFICSAIGLSGPLGLFAVQIPSDYLGRRTVCIYAFFVSAVVLFVFSRAGADPLVLFGLLFLVIGFAMPMLPLLCGPIATEAAPVGLVASSIGFVSGIGEVFGGGVAPTVAGYIAQHFSLRSALDSRQPACFWAASR